MFAAAISGRRSPRLLAPRDHTRDVHYELYRMGYYRGLGARFIKAEPARTIEPQQPCPANPTSGSIECDWAPAFDVTIDDAWVTGEYMFELITEDGTAWPTTTAPTCAGSTARA